MKSGDHLAAKNGGERSNIGRRAFLAAFFIGGCVLEAGGCAVFGKRSTSKDKKRTDDENESAFDVEREKNDDLSEYVSKTGRGGKEKKVVSRGETFLMSDKAREIYANTER